MIDEVLSISAFNLTGTRNVKEWALECLLFGLMFYFKDVISEYFE